jgi:DNA (cytosine-5)-methyltransferase 1
MKLIIDNFAGGGGASTGLEAAFGRPVDVAINHDEAAIAVHAANHPGTRHYCQSIYSVDPLDATCGRPVALVWFSPDCKHHSKAKGGKPRDKYIRDLAHVVPHWIERLKKATPGGSGAPAVIMLENVEEFRQWGPLDADGKPIKERRGEEFDLWVRRIRRQGYKVEWRELRACDYCVPTSRKRLFLVARRDGLPIVWPAPTHGKPGTPDVVSGKLLPWRTAAECIDWTRPCPSIFDRIRPLKDATCRRIAAGVMRYVVNSARPFIVPVTNSSWNPGRSWSADEPLRTITTAKGGEMAAVAPVFARTAHGERDSKGKKRGRGDHSVQEPFPTVTASRDSALIGASLLPVTHQGGDRAHAVDEPFRTITGAHRGEIALQSAAMLKLRKNSHGEDIAAPLGAVTAGGLHHGVVAASLVRQFGKSNAADIDQPMPTIVAGGGGKTLQIAASMVQTGYGEREGQAPRAIDAEQPLGTIVAGGGKHAAVAAFLAQHNTERGDRANPGHAADKPVSTITGRGTQQQVVQTTLIEVGDLPADVLDRAVQVAAFLVKYYGSEIGQHQAVNQPLDTITVKPRFAVVTVNIDAVTFVLVDIGMRMLEPRELARAQGFPESYILDPECWYRTDGGARKFGKLPKTHQIAKIGNSVCPGLAEALARANLPEMCAGRAVA